MLIRVIDFETTGMPDDPSGANVCEVGCCDVLAHFSEDGKFGGAEIDRANALLVNPGRKMPSVALAVHHITDDMLKDAPPVNEGLAYLTKGDPHYFCAHNSKFEQHFFPGGGVPWIDTWRVALRLWPDSPSHSNQVLRYELNLDIINPEFAMPPHRAAPDAYVTAHLLVACLRHGGASIEDMARWSTGAALLPRINFGKHKGKKWDQAPTDYLQWIVEKSDMDADIKANAKHHLKLRTA